MHCRRPYPCAACLLPTPRLRFVKSLSLLSRAVFLCRRTVDGSSIFLRQASGMSIHKDRPLTESCLDPSYRHSAGYLRCPSATFILWHHRSVLESLPSVRVRSLSISSSHGPHNRFSRLATTHPLLLERVGTPHKRTCSSSTVNGDSFRYSCSQVFRRVDAMRSRGLDQAASTNVINDNFVSGPLQMTCIKRRPPRVWALVHQPPLCLIYRLRWLLPSTTAGLDWSPPFQSYLVSL